MSEYTQQALAFAKKHGIKLTFIGEPQYKKHFHSDKERRFVFRCKLSRKEKGSYTFNFGQSIAMDAAEPTLYDILACLTKSDPGSFENFCGDFGYEQFSENERTGRFGVNKVSEKIYKAVCKEWDAVERLFGDILEELQEIQ